MVENGNSSQLARLQQLAKRGVTGQNKMFFSDLIICNLGVAPKEHFPKLKNADGTKQKDADGHDIRAEKPDGWTYTFSEFGTCNKVMAVVPKQYNLELLKVYQLSGLGYQMRDANMIYVDQDVKLSNY